MSDETFIGGFAHWQDDAGTWWYRDAIGVACVATLAMMPYLDTIAALRAELAGARLLTPEVLERAVNAYYTASGGARAGIGAALLAAGFQEADNG